jgi:hypothetical protein
MDKSRLGVIHNWMVELHSNVPHILKIPAIKQVMTSKGILRVYIHIRLQMIMAIQQVIKDVLEENRNFSRNIMLNVNAIPTMEAYPAIMISSCIKAREPTISLTAAKYIPPEN